MTRKTLLAAGLGVALAVSATAANAHEMFLKPTAFHLEPGAKTVVALFNGTIGGAAECAPGPGGRAGLREP